MNADSIQTAAVIGAGTMGHGVAQVLAMAGITTRLFDINQAGIDNGLSKIAANLAKGVARGKVTAEDESATNARLSGTTDMQAAIAGVDVVIEAVPEIMDLKKKIFTELGDSLGANVLLATNTSSLPIAEIASAARFPERVTGMHFFNPVHIMKLLEVVRAEQTSDETLAIVSDVGVRLGKELIVVSDSAGFATSRLGLIIGLEAMRMLESGVASAEEIDKAMELGYRHPMGPLRLTDLVGLDVRLAIAEHLFAEVGPQFRPPQILRRMVRAGKLGKKTGQGFYSW